MTEVVTDEGLFIRALGSERSPRSHEVVDPADQRARDLAAEVLQTVQDQHVWAISYDVYDTCFGRFWSASYKGVLWNRLLRSFRNMIIDPAKHRHTGDPPEIPGEYDPNDRRWVSCAAAASDGCLLITTDEDLVQQLEATELPALHHFVPLVLSEAESHL